MKIKKLDLQENMTKPETALIGDSFGDIQIKINKLIDWITEHEGEHKNRKERGLKWDIDMDMRVRRLEGLAYPNKVSDKIEKCEHKITCSDCSYDLTYKGSFWTDGEGKVHCESCFPNPQPQQIAEKIADWLQDFIKELLRDKNE